MPPAKILTSVKNERAIEFREGLISADVEAVGKFLLAAGQDGYRLTGVSAISGGSQRDPYTVGVRLTCSKP